MATFSYRVKSEICGNRVLCRRYKRAMTYGLLLYGREFGLDNIALHTENRRVARMYADNISDLIGLGGSITLREVPRQDRRSVFVVTVDALADRIAILSYLGYKAGEKCGLRREFLSEEELPAFVSGAFLACGAVANPEKGYRLELIIHQQHLAEELSALLGTLLFPPKETTRRNDYLLYYKESEQMEDLLTYIGAPKCALEMMEVKIIKTVRNKANRETNCETANIGKTIDAAMAQIESIRYIQAHGGLEQLSDELRELAALRLDNPEMSLRELGEALSEPISRSGVNHRLKRILEYAQTLRKQI